MKSPGVAFLSALLGAFLAGIGVYEFLEHMVDRKVAVLSQEVENAHQRLNAVQLRYGPAQFGDRFAAQAGDERRADDEAGKQGPTERHVMVGQWDGTGTPGGWSRNFYRELTLIVPARLAAP